MPATIAPRARGLVSILVFLPAGMAGCAPTPPPVPSVDQIATVQLTVIHFPANVVGKNGCSARFTERPDFADVLEWIGSVDWSQAGVDLAVVRLPEPDGRVEIAAKNGGVQQFPFFWDGRVVDEKGNRLLNGADVTKLRQLAQRGCK
jgi:hypothetical protein